MFITILVIWLVFSVLNGWLDFCVGLVRYRFRHFLGWLAPLLWDLAVGFAVWMVLWCSLLREVWFVGDFLAGYYLGLGFVVG